MSFKLVACLQQRKEPAGVFHGKPKQAVTYIGLCGQPVPDIHFQAIGRQQNRLFYFYQELPVTNATLTLPPIL